MLKMRKPLELKCFRRLAGFENEFHEKIRANYLLAAADFQAEDLLHLVMEPPSLLQEEGNTVFINHWKLELLTQLINRLLLSLTVKKPMTFQDGAFLDRALLGLGIRDGRSFLKELAKALQMEQNSEALLRLYRETQKLCGTDEREQVRKAGEERDGEKSAALWKRVYLRLDTVRLCREAREFIKNAIRLRRKAGPMELLAAEPAGSSRYVELSFLRDFISRQEERAVRPPANRYERAQNASSLPAGILFSLVHRVYTGVYLAAGEKTEAEKNRISIEPDFYGAADSFLRRFDRQREERRFIGEEQGLEEADGRRIQEERTFMEKLALSYLEPVLPPAAADGEGRTPPVSEKNGEGELEFKSPERTVPEKKILPASQISLSRLRKEMEQFFSDRRALFFETEKESGIREEIKGIPSAGPAAAVPEGEASSFDKRETAAAVIREVKNPIRHEPRPASKASETELIFRRWRDRELARTIPEWKRKSGQMGYKDTLEWPRRDDWERRPPGRPDEDSRNGRQSGGANEDDRNGRQSGRANEDSRNGRQSGRANEDSRKERQSGRSNEDSRNGRQPGRSNEDSRKERQPGRSNEHSRKKRQSGRSNEDSRNERQSGRSNEDSRKERASGRPDGDSRKERQSVWPDGVIREWKMPERLRPGIRVQRAAVLLWRKGEKPAAKLERYEVKEESTKFFRNTGQTVERASEKDSGPVRDSRVREKERIWLPVERRLFRPENRSEAVKRSNDGLLFRPPASAQKNRVNMGERPALRSGRISFPKGAAANPKGAGYNSALRLKDTAQRYQGKRGKQIERVIWNFEGPYRERLRFKIKGGVPLTVLGNASPTRRTTCFLRPASVYGKPGGEGKHFPASLLWEPLPFSDFQEKGSGSEALPEENRPSPRKGQEKELGGEKNRAVRALTRSAPPVTQTLKERLDAWNLRQVETYRHMLKTEVSEKTKSAWARRPDRGKTGRAAREFLVRPREAMEQFQSGGGEGAGKNESLAGNRSEAYLNRLDEISQRIYRGILSFGTGDTPSWIRRAPDPAVMKYLSAVSDEETIEAFRDSKERDGRKTLVYRRPALWPEEQRSGEQRTERIHEKERVKGYVEKIMESRAETAQLPASDPLRSGQTRKEVEKLIEKTMNGRLDTISERVYQRLEKRLKSERARRGLY